MNSLKPHDHETPVRMLVGALRGAARGAPAGVVASLVTGAAVVVTAPAWMPVVGGLAAVSLTTVAACSAIGAGVGAVSGAVAAYLRKRRIDRMFGTTFQEPEIPSTGRTEGRGRALAALDDRAPEHRMNLGGWISSAVATSKNAVLERFLQHALDEAGTVSNLVLDSHTKTLLFDLALKGEAAPLPIAVYYSLKRDARGTWLTIREVTTSKPWADILAKRFLKDPIKLPNAVQMVL